MTRRTDTDCRTCHGNGYIETKHPRWGSSTCPAPTEERICPSCGGSGRGWAA